MADHPIPKRRSEWTHRLTKPLPKRKPRHLACPRLSTLASLQCRTFTRCRELAAGRQIRPAPRQVAGGARGPLGRDRPERDRAGLHVRFGKNPPNYCRSYDGVTTFGSPKPWELTVREGQHLDADCRGQYSAVEIPMTLTEAVELKRDRKTVEGGTRRQRRPGCMSAIYSTSAPR